ncbi:MAG: S8 family serine peptidase, partial [Atopobiaceae bacterium]|nr:S8 family serine peptidase [Atopobiaceae bacterium]
MKPHVNKKRLTRIAVAACFLALLVVLGLGVGAPKDKGASGAADVAVNNPADARSQKDASATGDADKDARGSADARAQPEDGAHGVTDGRTKSATESDAAKGDAVDAVRELPRADVDDVVLSEVPVTPDEAANTVTLGDDAQVVAPTGSTAVELVDEPIFEIPPDAQYVPQEVLAIVDKNMDGDQLAGALRACGAQTVDVDSAQWITDDVVRLTVAPGSTVEEAVNELLVSGVMEGAQPDYLFGLDDDVVTPEHAAVREEEGDVAAEEEASVGDAAKDDATEDELATDDAADKADEAAQADPEPVDEPADEPGDEALELVDDEAVDLVDKDGATEDAQGQDGIELVDDADVEVTQDDAADAYDVAIATAQAGSTSGYYTDPFFVNGFQWGLQSINAPEVWDKAKATTMRKVGVAVIDCGFDVNHPDLKSVIAPGSAYNAYRATQGIDDEDLLADVASGAYPNSQDEYEKGCGRRDHGMHVAGIIAAQRNNFEGIAGVSDNAQIVPIRAYDYSETDSQASISAIVKGIDYVIKNQDTYNIRVVNLSMGATVSTIGVNDVLGKKIDEAFKKGIVTVCSAGNDGQSGSCVNYPGDWASAVSVINLKNDTYMPRENSTDGYYKALCSDPQSVTRYSTSNYNAVGERSKDISAPGSDIVSTSDYSMIKYSRGYINYMFDTGTSMSAPHVAGVLAIMFGKADVPKTAAGAQQMVDMLFGSARPIKQNVVFDRDYGYGEVDALAAWDAVDSPTISGPTYVKVGQAGVSYSVQAGKAGTSTSGWRFSSSDTNVLQVNASTGACTVKGAGAADIVATKSGQARLLKSVVAFGGQAVGNSVLFIGSSAQYTPSTSALMAWEWSAKGDGLASSGMSMKGSGVLSAANCNGPIKVTLSATASLPKEMGDTITLTKDVYVAGKLAGGGTLKVGGTKKLSLALPEGLSLSSNLLVWGSNDDNVATVSAGVVTARHAGTTSIWVAPKEAVSKGANGKTQVAKGSYQSVNIKVTDSIASSRVKASAIGSKTYTGKAIKPKPVLTAGTATLKQGTDYTVSYSNNTKVGTARIKVVGKGVYAGSSRSLTFKIVKAKISSAKAAAIAKQAYTGKAIKPKPRLTYAGKTLRLGTDYALSYKSNAKAGTATVVVTGKGNFEGTKSVKFKIVAPSVTYRSYVQGKGWQAWAKNGRLSGT